MTGGPESAGADAGSGAPPTGQPEGEVTAATGEAAALSLPSVEVSTRSAEETTRLGYRLATALRAGDVVILVGDLGAGKTTLTRGLGAGLGVRGQVTSPTFVISRLHAPDAAGGVALVHVDAYRLAAAAELDDLDIDAFTEDSVTVVEWGEGVAESLSDSWLRVHIATTAGGAAADARRITVTPVGPRWVGISLRELAAP
jgi:tRNA threonylcarbamoyladenosine biosynthesis protein TsaE